MSSKFKLQPIKRLPAGDLQYFKDYLKGSGQMGAGMSRKRRAETLHQYIKSKGGMLGEGKKKTSGNLVRGVKQVGGSWSDFTDFFTKTIPRAFGSAASKVRDTAKEVSNRIAQVAKDRASGLYNYVKNKPLSAIGAAAGALSKLPIPGTQILKPIGIGASAIGQLTGKGKQPGRGKKKMVTTAIDPAPMEMKGSGAEGSGGKVLYQF